jgi:PPOX class probable F420-dependent enzyme
MAADLDLVRRLGAADHGLAVVATTRGAGSVQASLVNAGVLDHPVGGEPVLGIVVRGDALKVRLMRRAGRAAVTFRAGWEWVTVEGPVSIIGPADPAPGVELPPLLRAIFTAAGGTHEDWDEFDRVMADEGRLAVFVSPARISSN